MRRLTTDNDGEIINGQPQVGTRVHSFDRTINHTNARAPAMYTHKRIL